MLFAFQTWKWVAKLMPASVMNTTATSSIATESK